MKRKGCELTHASLRRGTTEHSNNVREGLYFQKRAEVDVALFELTHDHQRIGVLDRVGGVELEVVRLCHQANKGVQLGLG